MRRRLDEDGLRTIGQTQDVSDTAFHYQTSIIARISNDAGVILEGDDGGDHGRYAEFSDTRIFPFVGEPRDYTIGLVRGAITTNTIPLYTALPSKLVTEQTIPFSPTNYWEVTMQPGLALTWTGPVYRVNNASGIRIDLDRSYASWPTYGAIPYYSTATNLTGVTQPVAAISGWLDLSVFASNDVIASQLAARLQNLVIGAGMSLTVTAGGAPPATASSTQFLTFVNSSTTTSYNFDFSLPAYNAEYNQGVSPRPTKQGILQACKLLGFIPGSVFVIPAGATVVCPRAYQLGFRATMNLYSYKTARWVPEDDLVPMPSVGDVVTGAYSKSPYFDCQTYQHLLNEVVNPTFQRLIYDEFDSGLPLSEQCLLRQLQTACAANCSATAWNPTTTYARGVGVYYNGSAYAAVNNGTVGIPPTITSIAWLYCGPYIKQTWNPAVFYQIGDAVTYIDAGTPTSSIVWGANAANINTPPSLLSGTWSNNGSIQAGTGNVTPNVPQIGTAAPTITYNATNNLFSLNLDSYGFGGTSSTNADDGYGLYVDDPQTQASYAQQLQNATLNDQARDSWGLTGTPFVTTPAYTTFRKPYQIYDERFVIEADDYFNQLFGNWPLNRLSYVDPITQINTSYVRYTPQAVNAALTVPNPLPVVMPTVVSSGSWLPYARVAGNQPYMYSFAQDYSSIGAMWNPVDTVVIVSQTVPIVDDQTGPPYFVGDSVGIANTVSGFPNSLWVGATTASGVITRKPQPETLKVLAEFTMKPTWDPRGFRNEFTADIQTPVRLDMHTTNEFKTFDFAVYLRMKATGKLRLLTLSNSGSAFFRWEFLRKFVSRGG